MSRRMRFPLAAAAAVWAMGAGAYDGGYGTLGYKMYHEPFPYYLNDNLAGAPQLGISAIENATNRAFQVWQDVDCGYVSFAYGGRTSAKAAITNPKDARDSYSVSTNWVTDRADPYYQLALGGEAAAASIPLTYGGALLQCDIYTNGIDYAWSAGVTNPGVNVMDLQTAVSREVGHCMGLADTQMNMTAIMYFVLNPGETKWTPDNYDHDATCYWYPDGGYAAPCSGIGTQGTCGSASLKCITSTWPGGATTKPYCSKGCTLGAINSCDPPLVCTADTTTFPGFSGACKPANNNVVQVGRECDGGTVGNCGPTAATCFVENRGGALPSGYPMWPGGYCTQSCSTGSPCPAGATCVDFGASGMYCLENCRPGTGDCRPGYACSSLAAGNVCISACHNDLDCPNPSGGPSLCRTCDGVCFAKENPGVEIGAPCANNSNCGPNQYCFKFNYSSTGVCTQSCTTSCSSCPNGSSCLGIPPTNQKICMRDCQDGTCGAGLMCGAIPAGRGCMPACANDLACPTGWHCSYGQCVDPAAVLDAGGTCALCFSPGPGGGGGGGVLDGGGGGGGNPGTGGCGCQGSGAGLLAAAALLVVLTSARRRRTWPSR